MAAVVTCGRPDADNYLSCPTGTSCPLGNPSEFFVTCASGLGPFCGVCFVALVWFLIYGTMLARCRALLSRITVEPAIFFYFLAIYLLYSVFHPLVYSKACLAHLTTLKDFNFTCATLGQLNTTAAKEASQRISEDTNYWIRLSSICFTLPSLVGDIMLGSWGDLYGRRLPLFLPSVGGRACHH